uniref:Uncharacterized protein n=1 Tax=Anopheles atroparvus TaxID=41427 RepID=A0A182IJP1_ANOAO
MFPTLYARPGYVQTLAACPPADDAYDDRNLCIANERISYFQRLTGPARLGHVPLITRAPETGWLQPAKELACPEPEHSDRELFRPAWASSTSPGSGAVTDDVGVAVVAHEVIVRPGVAVLDGVPGGHAARHPRGTVVDDLREVGEVGTGVAVRVAIDEVDRQRVLVEPVVDDVPDHAILGQVQPEVPDDGDVLAGLREARRVAAVVVRVHARACVRLCQQLELVVPVELRHPVGRKVAGQQAAGNLLPLPVVLLQYGGFAPRRHRHLHRLTVVASAAESRCRGAA